MLRASSLPALKECACYEPGHSDFQESGTDRHKALEEHFKGDDSLLDLLPEEDRDGVKWAADYIRVHAPTSEAPLTWEKENAAIAIVGDDFTEIPGTPDAVCGLEIFDLKWRQFNYDAQMACYALMRLQAPDVNPNVEIRVHVLFGCTQKAVVLKFDLETARQILGAIVARYNDPKKEPTPCDYCGWCANRLTCSALNERAQAVAAGRNDWQLQTYHTSKLSTPAEAAKALALARLLKEWCTAVEYHAREIAIKKGVTIPGYELKSKNGKSSCADIIGAFHASSLTAEEFLQCCEIRIATSKENPDKRGLADVLAIKKSISKAAAKRELKKTLEPFMRTPKEILYLKANNETEETIDA